MSAQHDQVVEQNARTNRIIMRLAAVFLTLILIVVVGVGVGVFNLALKYGEVAAHTEKITKEGRLQAVRNEIAVLEDRKRLEECVVAYLKAFAANDNSRQPLQVIPKCEEHSIVEIEMQLEAAKKRQKDFMREDNGTK